MSCSPFELKDYFFGELSPNERQAVEQHLSECQVCREELHGLKLTRSALLAIPEHEPPRRIAFVSDKVFEPRWWQRIWNSTPQLGFVSACILALAILVHGFQLPRIVQAPAATPVTTAGASPEQTEAEIARRVEAAVQKAVAESEERQATKLLQAVNMRLKQADSTYQLQLENIQEYLVRVHKENALNYRAAHYSKDSQ